jgi:fumarylacetoacetate (FAA) hydrolase family protein
MSLVTEEGFTFQLGDQIAIDIERTGCLSNTVTVV